MGIYTCASNATDAKGRPLREDNIQGFKDASGRLLRVGDVIETIKGVEKGHRSKIVGFKGLYVFCDDGGQISRGYCDMVKVVNSSVLKSVNAGTSEGVNSTDKVVANALKHAARTAKNGVEACGSTSFVVKNSDEGNCNSCANGCKGHKCRLGLSTKVAMNSGRKCKAWRADSLTRAVKRVAVNAKDWVGKTIRVGDKVTPAGSLKGRTFEVLEVYGGDRVKVRVDDGREMNMRSNGLFVTNSGEVKNMSAETAISRIEWMLGSSRREDRDEAAAELENYRDIIIARAGKAKYDEMMRRACNGEVTAVNMSKPPALGKALFDAIGYSKVLRNYGSRDGSGGVVLKVTYPEFMGLGFDSVVSRANAFWKRWGYAGKWSVSKMSEKNDKGVLTLVVEIKEM